MIIDGDAYLQHYGVKGMKWGVRRDRGGSSKVGFTDAEVQIAAMGAILVASTLVKLKDKGAFTLVKTRNTPWKQNPELSKKMSVKDLQDKVVKPINPGYGAKGTMMNCRRATFAYEMRRRGNDVKATKSVMAMGQGTEGLLKATSKADRKSYESAWGRNLVTHPRIMATSTPEKKSNDIFNALGKQPNGSRGEISVGWYFAGGHSMAYEVVNKKPVIFDAQSGVTYASPAAFNRISPMVSEAAFTRLDNANINDRFIRGWATNVDD